MKAFQVKGSFRASERAWQSFTLQVASEDTAGAEEKVKTMLGSRHRTPRRSIKIDDVKELGDKDITDSVVRHQVGVKP